jgi:hypothetical protein
VKDAEWIAGLVRHVLIAKSFVPPPPLRELRELLRYRRKLVKSQAAERNRLLKLLETANFKLASVASDVFGVLLISIKPLRPEPSPISSAASNAWVTTSPSNPRPALHDLSPSRPLFSWQSRQKHALGLDPGVAFPVLRKNTERTFIVSGKRSLCENKGI